MQACDLQEARYIASCLRQGYQTRETQCQGSPSVCVSTVAGKEKAWRKDGPATSHLQKDLSYQVFCIVLKSFASSVCQRTCSDEKDEELNMRGLGFVWTAWLVNLPTSLQ